MIFPLPLTPFEEYMLTDDRPGCPMTFLFRLRFSGRFRREAFASALRTAVSRHPLLRAIVRPGGEIGRSGSRPMLGNRGWSDATGLADGSLPHADPMDLSVAPGLRLWLSESEKATDLVAQFHHASCDGLGAMAFLEDLLVASRSELWGGPRRHFAPHARRRAPCDSGPLRPDGVESREASSSATRGVAGCAAVPRSYPGARRALPSEREGPTAPRGVPGEPRSATQHRGNNRARRGCQEPGSDHQRSSHPRLVPGDGRLAGTAVPQRESEWLRLLCP